MMKNKENLDEIYEYGFNNDDNSIIKFENGLNEEIIRKISAIKNEPKWMLDIRLSAYQEFLKHKNPSFGPDLSFINFQDICYYSSWSKSVEDNWDKVPKKIKETFNKIGILEAEAKFLHGVSTQYDSEIIYKKLANELLEQGVIFTNIETAIKQYPDLVKKYFGKLVPYTDNKYAALNTAVWSGGSFIYVPENVVLDKPLQAYFRINGLKMGQFERTLIIVKNKASLHYVEGCTAPIYDENNLHAAVVEIYVEENANCRYTTIQNWSKNVINLVTKRARVSSNGKMSWIDGNIGSGINMKYPCSILIGDGARSDSISMAIGSSNKTCQDVGAKMIHLAPNTRSSIISKSISMDGGDTRYRGIVHIGKDAINSIASIKCDTLILDNHSRSDTIPKEIVENNMSSIDHEAKVSTINDSQLFYLMSKGISKEQAEFLLILGFIEPFTKELPMEYAVELNRLIKLDMKDSIG